MGRKQNKSRNKPKPEPNMKTLDKEIIRKLSQSSIILKTKSVKEMANEFEQNPDDKTKDNTTTEMDEDNQDLEENSEYSEEDGNSTEDEEEEVFSADGEKDENTRI